MLAMLFWGLELSSWIASELVARIPLIGVFLEVSSASALLIFAGTTMVVNNLPRDLDFREGLLGSQSSYKVTEEQAELMKLLGVVALDMEAAPEAQILQQTK